MGGGVAMRLVWISIVLATAASGVVSASPIWARIATFENLAAGTNFNVSFTDPQSAIFFHGSTTPPPPGGFSIDHSTLYPAWGNYLTVGGPSDSFGAHFGFTGDLP